jgi:hypothetical protein
VLGDEIGVVVIPLEESGGVLAGRANRLRMKKKTSQ